MSYIVVVRQKKKRGWQHTKKCNQSKWVTRKVDTWHEANKLAKRFGTWFVREEEYQTPSIVAKMFKFMRRSTR